MKCQRHHFFHLHIKDLVESFAILQHLQSPTSIFRFVHFNTNGIQYKATDKLDTFHTKFSMYLQDIKPSVTSLNEHNLDLTKPWLKETLQRKITNIDKQATVSISTTSIVKESYQRYSHESTWRMGGTISIVHSIL